MTTSPSPDIIKDTTSVVSNSVGKPRSSNLELYRILCMIMIVAHHYVVNSGLTSADGPLMTSPHSSSSLFLYLFGMWGKTAINCFLMITGYFMCKSQITIRKFVKLLSQIYLYQLVIYIVFLQAGYESFGIMRLFRLLMPVWDFTSSSFTSCFIAFYLTIPFLSILVQNMSKRQHQLLLLLLLGCYTILGSLPGFNISFNYITWFGVLFFIASYIRMYPNPFYERSALWGWLTVLSVAMAMGSVVIMQTVFGKWSYFYVSDSNKILALIVAVCSFLWFRNMNISQSRLINAVGGSTFGVLLIHANSDAMRSWLWKDFIDVVGHYTLPLGKLFLFSIGVVLSVFFICCIVDLIRKVTVERWFFSWYDRRIATRLEDLIQVITKG